MKRKSAAVKQHTEPCKECPWVRTSVPGWLGPGTADEWLATAHSDEIVECHMTAPLQCAGAAIYRRNVAKSPRDVNCLRLPADRAKVFSNPMEFKAHHEEMPLYEE